MLQDARRFMVSLAFIVPGLAYLVTLAPDITWAYQGTDGGDLITAAYTLGVPHPSGYPTYVLMGWLFSKLPLGTIAWRFNLLSALSMTGAAWLIFNSVNRLTGSWLAALTSAWTFAFTPLVWSQAIITEVYGLNVFCVTLLIWLGLQIRSGQGHLSFWLGITFGLALGVHLTILLLMPVMIWVFYDRWRTIASWAILGFFVGILIFSYLPLRANQGAITWETPNTWSGFLALVSGRIYHGYLFNLPLTALGPRILMLFGYLADLGFFALVLLGLGLRWAWHNARSPLYWTAATAGGYIIYATGYRTADSYIYMLPVFALGAIGLGLGVNDVMSNLVTRPQQAIIGAVILGLTLFWGGSHGSTLSLRNDWRAQMFWQMIMTQAPPKAVLLTYQDEHTFTLWYAQHVLKQRSDVAIVDTGLLTYSWYRRDLGRAYPWLTDLDNLAERFQQRGNHVYHLCAVLGTEQIDRWRLDCLTPLPK